MDLTYSAQDETFRSEVRSWLRDNLSGDFAGLRGKGGPGREHEEFEGRLEWDRHLASAGWTCLGWPEEHGGRGLSLLQQVIFHEEYAEANAPARVNHIGEELLGPTLIAFGSEEQRARFLPGVRSVTELWCQGYSEPGAGSDLASVSTRATLEPSTDAGQPGEWIVNGQKVWTSLAHVADWCFVLARTEPESTRHHGLSMLLVPMQQAGVEVRPIEQLTGTSEFNEVFFDGARTAGDLVVGEAGEGWRVAMGTLGFERGVSTVGQQVGFARELDAVVAVARRTGAIDDPVVRDRLVRARTGLEVMRLHALRTLSSSAESSASVSKLVWANWHRRLGELAMLVTGSSSLLARSSAQSSAQSSGGATYDLDELQRLFLFTRADTIYGGSNEIQRNIIAERVLGLPREWVPEAHEGRHRERRRRPEDR